MTDAATIPYCGSPPVPGTVIWNTDPVLICLLLAIPVFYALACRGPDAPASSRQLCFYAGWVLVAGALLSPLCNLSVALFSARVAQHMVLTLLAAPLVVLGMPAGTLRLLLPDRARAANPWLSGGRLHAIGGCAFAAALWTWHLPGPYDATLRSDAAYWTMHITTFGSAMLLWHALFFDHANIWAELIAGFGTTIQMSLLGALLTLSAQPLFAVHAATTWPWGLSPLTDQQLGGAIMWVPGGLVFTAYSLLALGLALRRMNDSHVPEPLRT